MPPPYRHASQGATTKREAIQSYDGGGLYIEVFPDGAKRWRYKYRFEGKEKRLALGVYLKSP